MKNTACSLILITASSMVFATDPFETDGQLVPTAVFGELSHDHGEADLNEHEIIDLNLIAESNGWTLSQAKTHRRSIKRIGFYAPKLARTHPDVFVGAVAPDDWNGNPVIYIKGAVDQVLLSELNARGLDVIDSRPYSLFELKKKQSQIHSILSDVGYKYIATSIDIREGMVKAKATRTDDVTTRPYLSVPGVVITYEDDPVAIHHGFSHGGMVAASDDFRFCTTGWTVTYQINQNASSHGVSTAGHCSEVSMIKHDGETHNAWLVREHRGFLGDMELLSLSQGGPNTADFYASENEVRPVNTIQSVGSIVVGEPLCLYGRASNQRDCSRRVQATSMTCSFGEVVVTGNLVQMDGEIGTFGDSGGGWSWGTRAVGSHVGLCGGGSVFTPVALFGRGIGGTVTTQ